MAETIGDRKVFSLLDVNNSIRKTLVERYSSAFWVTAEMNKLNHYSHSGHCYPELVEKNEGKVVALMTSHLWRTDYERINQKFLHILQEPLKNGIKILFLASINYDPVYGISLWIKDIDPSYSLGELEKEKKETIERLTQEGIFDLNKQLPLAVLPKRIAIISVETSKGYSDFLKVLDYNPFGYQFFHFLFPALLQGDRSVVSIIRQLKEINKVKDHFDIVAIIRGGGGDVGLSSYNNYELSSAIARFPLPVITGIGHSTNETVSEIVSYKNAITPTELADWLIQKFHNFSVPLADAEKNIVSIAENLIKMNKNSFEEMVRLFKSLTTNQIRYSNTVLDNFKQKLPFLSNAIVQKNKSVFLPLTRNFIQYSKQQIHNTKSDLKNTIVNIDIGFSRSMEKQKNLIEFEEKKLQLLNPDKILRRGYTITINEENRIVKEDNIAIGSTVTTITKFGKVKSTINAIN